MRLTLSGTPVVPVSEIHPYEQPLFHEFLRFCPMKLPVEQQVPLTTSEPLETWRILVQFNPVSSFRRWRDIMIKLQWRAGGAQLEEDPKLLFKSFIKPWGSQQTIYQRAAAGRSGKALYISAYVSKSNSFSLVVRFSAPEFYTAFYFVCAFHISDSRCKSS